MQKSLSNSAAAGWFTECRGFLTGEALVAVVIVSELALLTSMSAQLYAVIGQRMEEQFTQANARLEESLMRIESCSAAAPAEDGEETDSSSPDTC